MTNGRKYLENDNFEEVARLTKQREDFSVELSPKNEDSEKIFETPQITSTMRKFECLECEGRKLFANKANLQTHIKIVHQGFKGYKCGFCDQLFSSKGNRNDH